MAPACARSYIATVRVTCVFSSPVFDFRLGQNSAWGYVDSSSRSLRPGVTCKKPRALPAESFIPDESPDDGRSVAVTDI